jgi:nucleolin
VVSKSSSPSFLTQSKVQSAISPSVFRRFASDDANSESRPVAAADAEEHGTIRSAIDSAAESTSTYTKDAEESLAQSTEPARETYGGDRGAEPTSGLASGFPRAPRQNRYNDRKDNYTTRSDNPRSDNPRSNNPRVLEPTSGIYIGNLLFDVTAKDLEREFEQFGPIKSTVIATDARGLSKG